VELRQAVGDSHPYTLAAAAGLATDLALIHETASAVRILEDVVSRAKDQLGTNHPSTLGFEANLGLDMMAAGERTTGKDLRARAVAELAAIDGDLADRSLDGGRVECDIEPPES
jgi:hypothetical protein